MGLYVLEIKANIKGFILIYELANSLHSYILLSLFLVLPTILSTTFSSAHVTFGNITTKFELCE